MWNRQVLGLLLWLLGTGYAMAQHEKIVYGYIEKVVLVERKLTISAKLDTGAKSSSLHAQAIQEVMMHGRPYLRFVVPSRDGDQTFLAEYLGDVNIKIRSGESRIAARSNMTMRRPVVQMRVRMGNQERMIRVNLTNRHRFNYPFLMGREAIVAFNGMIDPALKFTIKKTMSGTS